LLVGGALKRSILVLRARLALVEWDLASQTGAGVAQWTGNDVSTILLNVGTYCPN